MTLRRPFRAPAALLLLIAAASVAPAQERHSTENFVVSAPTRDLARTFGERAEAYRKEKAMDWLGYEMKPWPKRCPLQVVVEPNRTGGETTFEFFEKGGVSSQHMKIFGGVEQLLNSVLPHEITHTVFAAYFGQAVPRWADEGGSVYSENDEERYQHDVRCRELLNKGGVAFPLRVLFSMNKYPPDMHTLYAEGYSVVNFLVEKGGRKRFLDFVRTGMQNGNRNWEQAAVQVYEYQTVDDLQADWIQSLKATRPQRAGTGKAPLVPGDAVAAAPRKAAPAATLASSARGPQTRTSPGGVPMLDDPVVARGVPPAGEPAGRPAPPAVLPLPTPIKLGAPEVPVRK